MTDDEQAQAVLDLLTGIVRCPECHNPMRERVTLAAKEAPFDEVVWLCMNNKCRVHSLGPGGKIYRYLGSFGIR